MWVLLSLSCNCFEVGCYSVICKLPAIETVANCFAAPLPFFGDLHVDECFTAMPFGALGDRKGIAVKGCRKLGVGLLLVTTGASHVLQLQLSPPPPPCLAAIESTM